MEFKTKVMFLGTVTGTTKEDKIYKAIQFLDKKSNDTFKVYVESFGKYEKMQPYTDCEVSLDLYKDVKNLYRLKLLEV